MALVIEDMRVDALKPYAGNARTHSTKQIKLIADSIHRFGFNSPILVSDDNTVIAGHGRLMAAKQLGLINVPVLRLSHMTRAEVKAYTIADNRTAELAGWDAELLALEFQTLIEMDFDLDLTGFAIAEVDAVMTKAADAKAKGPDPEDVTPEVQAKAVTAVGDVYILGRHRLVCGDARDLAAYAALMAGGAADMIFTDPPYNVAIDGHVGGKGKVKHREFAMASGEMSDDQFKTFLVESLEPAAKVCRDGAIAFVCMDYRHLPHLLAAGEEVFDRWMNLIVWAKTNAGMGSFYRSQHELIAAFKAGEAPHTNTFGLGATGRHRSNVWTYAGANSFRAGRMDDLNMHPTVKPVALIEDAIKDVTKRGQVVLDQFGGSGTTLIAAEKCGRVARLIELDPLYCDVIVRRWQTYTGKVAHREADGLAFDAIETVTEEAA